MAKNTAFRPNRQRSLLLLRLLITGILSCVVIAIAVSFAERTGEETLLRQRQATEDALRRAAVSCYSIEGVYPQKLDYLEEHYGLTIDREQFVVDYQLLGDNILPQITVVIRGRDAF